MSEIEDLRTRVEKEGKELKQQEDRLNMLRRATRKTLREARMREEKEDVDKSSRAP